MSNEDFNNWEQIAQAFDTAIGQVVRKGAFDVQAAMQAQIRTNGQVDTSFMMNSVYVVTSQESTYGQGVGSPPEGATLLPEVERPEDDKTAYVGVGASYGIYQNYGTVHQPARPFVEPAVDAVRPGFEAAMGKIEDRLREIRS